MENKIRDNIKEQLQNVYFHYEKKPCAALDFLLLNKEKNAISRYAIAWKEIGDLPANNLAYFAKDQIRASLKPIWLLRELGLCVIFSGPESTWSHVTKIVRADKTGMRSVILQGVIFLDCNTGAMHVDGSSWGPVKFGHTEKIKELIQSEIQKIKLMGLE